MADRYLKFAYNFYVEYTAGNWRGNVTSDLPQSAFISYPPYYSYSYGWYGFSADILVPAKLRMYQQFVTFHDRIMLDIMNPANHNYAYPDTTPTDLADVVIDPSGTDTTFYSGLGDENSYVYQHAYGYITHAEIEMRNPATPAVSGTSTITFNDIFVFHEDETTEYNALLASYPNNVTMWSPYPARDRLYIGDDPVDKLYIGNNQISKIYFRNEVIKE